MMNRAGIARLVFICVLANCESGLYASSPQGISAVVASSDSSNHTATGSAQKPQTRGVGAAKEKKPAQGSQSSGQVKKGKRLPRGVVQLFAQAMQLYNAGKFAEALVAFDAIHRKYPAHEPTVVQYAKTLYRLDRIPES